MKNLKLFRPGKAPVGPMLLAIIAASCLAGHAWADTITFGGVITQSTVDGTGPAVNHPDLNSVLDGDTYTVTLSFNESINGPGAIPLSGLSMTFLDISQSIFETEFVSATVSVTSSAPNDDISILGCLSTGSACNVGNQLDANFQILAADLNAKNVSAQGITGLIPSLHLLEDDGVTDIQGSISNYSYTGQASVPEPSMLRLVIFAAACMGFIRSRRMVRPTAPRGQAEEVPPCGPGTQSFAHNNACNGSSC